MAVGQAPALMLMSAKQKIERHASHPNWENRPATNIWKTNASPPTEMGNRTLRTFPGWLVVPPRRCPLWAETRSLPSPQSTRLTITVQCFQHIPAEIHRALAGFVSPLAVLLVGHSEDIQGRELRHEPPQAKNIKSARRPAETRARLASRTHRIA